MATRASAIDMILTGEADEPVAHGGDLGAARRLFPDAPEPFIDLSTGINPNPYPLPRFSADLYARLPEPAAVAALAAAAARAYGAPSADHVVAAPGTQILLPLVAGLVPAGRAAIFAPGYPEHARAAALAGHTFTRRVSDRSGRRCHTRYSRQSEQSRRKDFHPRRSRRLGGGVAPPSRLTGYRRSFHGRGAGGSQLRRRPRARQRRRVALVREVFWACRRAARFCACRAGAGGADSVRARPMGGIRSGAGRRHQSSGRHRLDRADAQAFGRHR